MWWFRVNLFIFLLNFGFCVGVVAIFKGNKGWKTDKFIMGGG